MVSGHMGRKQKYVHWDEIQGDLPRMGKLQGGGLKTFLSISRGFWIVLWWQRLQGQAGPIYGLLIGGKMLGLTHCNISHPFIMYYFFSFLPQVSRKKEKPWASYGKVGKNPACGVKTPELRSRVCHQLSVLSVLRPLCFSFPFREKGKLWNHVDQVQVSHTAFATCVTLYKFFKNSESQFSQL